MKPITAKLLFSPIHFGLTLLAGAIAGKVARFLGRRLVHHFHL